MMNFNRKHTQNPRRYDSRVKPSQKQSTYLYLKALKVITVVPTTPQLIALKHPKPKQSKDFNKSGFVFCGQRNVIIQSTYNTNNLHNRTNY